MATKRKQVPSDSIYAITTHHTYPHDAAEAWHECHVCATGHSDPDKADYSMFRQMGRGDLVLAYACDNRIAYVGEIENGKLEEENENIVSLERRKGGFGYDQQKQVKWFEKPHHFSRKDLPPYLSNQLGKRGRSVVQINLKGRSFKKVKDDILGSARWMRPRRGAEGQPAD